MIPQEIHEEIMRRLAAVEREHGVRILLAACRRQGSSAAKSPERAIFHGLFGQYLDIDTANPAKSVLAQPIFRNDALSPTGC